MSKCNTILRICQSLALVFLLSCGGPVGLIRHPKTQAQAHFCELPVPVVTTANVASIAQAHVSSAVAYYNAILGRQVFFFLGAAPPGFTAENLEPIGIVVAPHDMNPGSMGQWTARLGEDGCWHGGLLLFNQNYQWTHGKFQSMLRHELGHALGLGESMVSTRMMYYTIPDDETGVRVLSDAELEVLRGIYGEQNDAGASAIDLGALEGGYAAGLLLGYILPMPVGF